MNALACGRRNDGVRLTVHVKPRSSRSEVVGTRDDGALSIALKAPPVDGAANAELIKLLARTFDVRKRDITIASGSTARRKLIDIAGLSPADIEAKL